MFGIDDMAVASIGSSLISGIGSMFGGSSANKAAKNAMYAQMDFQEKMSSTAHQREVADLRKAGLNPILSADGGSGAAMASGASYTPQDVLSPAISSALTTRRLGAEIEQMTEQNRKIATDSKLNNALIVKALSDARVSSTQAKMLDYELKGVKNVAAVEDSPLGKYLPYAERLLGVIGGLVGTTAKGIGAGAGLKYLNQPSTPSIKLNLPPNYYSK